MMPDDEASLSESIAVETLCALIQSKAATKKRRRITRPNPVHESRPSTNGSQDMSGVKESTSDKARSTSWSSKSDTSMEDDKHQARPKAKSRSMQQSKPLSVQQPPQDDLSDIRCDEQLSPLGEDRYSTDDHHSPEAPTSATAVLASDMSIDDPTAASRTHALQAVYGMQVARHHAAYTPATQDTRQSHDTPNHHSQAAHKADTYQQLTGSAGRTKDPAGRLPQHGSLHLHSRMSAANSSNTNSDPSTSEDDGHARNPAARGALPGSLSRLSGQQGVTGTPGSARGKGRERKSHNNNTKVFKPRIPTVVDISHRNLGFPDPFAQGNAQFGQESDWKIPNQEGRSQAWRAGVDAHSLPYSMSARVAASREGSVQQDCAARQPSSVQNAHLLRDPQFNPVLCYLQQKKQQKEQEQQQPDEEQPKPPRTQEQPEVAVEAASQS